MGLRTFSLSLPFLSSLPQGRKPGSAVVVLYRKTRPADAQISVTHVHASTPADGGPNSGCNTTCRRCNAHPHGPKFWPGSSCGKGVFLALSIHRALMAVCEPDQDAGSELDE